MTIATSNKIKNFSFLCACVVVLTHAARGAEVGSVSWFISTYIYGNLIQITVPFFFVVSGFFLARHFEDDGWYKREVLKRVHSILIPYVLVSCIWWVFDALLTMGANAVHGREIMFDVGASWLDIFGLIPWKQPSVYPLWYLRALLIVVIISPIVKYLLRYRGGGVLILWLIYLWVRNAFDLEWVNMFEVTIPMRGLWYFTLGAMISKYGLEDKAPSKAVSIALIVISAILAFFRLYVLFVPLFVLGIWAFVSSKEWPKAFSGNSFAIYMLHLFPLFAMNLIVNVTKLRGLSDSVWYVFVPKGILAIVFSIVVISALRRFVPLFASKFLGGR